MVAGPERQGLTAPIQSRKRRCQDGIKRRITYNRVTTWRSGRRLPYTGVPVRRVLLVVCAACWLVSPIGAAQKRVAGFIEEMPTEKLKSLFPNATAFTPRGEEPLHFKVYDTDPKAPGTTPIGYAFWTTDLVPEQVGYHGHIHMLIGMDTMGILTGVIVDWNTEPYADISIATPQFPAMFPGKSIRDKFIPGEDVGIMSRATITVRAAAREIRDASRMVARAVLSPSVLRQR
jgi:transcriptional regulator of nitric oxide reductase